MQISCLSDNQVTTILASTRAPTPAPTTDGEVGHDMLLQEQPSLDELEWTYRVGELRPNRRERRPLAAATAGPPGSLQISSSALAGPAMGPRWGKGIGHP